MIVAFIDPQVAKVFIAVDKEWARVLPGYLNIGIEGHDQIAWEWSGNRALREGKWKLVWDKLDKRWSLFDLEADRTETNDLASANPKRVARLKKDWFAWAKKCGFNIDKLPGR